MIFVGDGAEARYISVGTKKKGIGLVEKSSSALKHFVIKIIKIYPSI